jgi:nitrate reductase gamma subunit
MTALLYVWIYICLLVSLAACAVRALRYARAPLHLRWELYPVPHEAPKRAAYGGSRFEEIDWWTKTEPSNKLGELKAMGSEILFLKGVWEFNRGLWFSSYPFHLGLYLLIATGVTATAGAMIPALAPLLHPLYMFTGLAGAALSLLGATGLLIRRLSDARLRIYTTPGDLFNLLFFIGTTAALLVSYAIRPEDAPGTGAILRGLLTFDTGVQLAGAQAVALALAAALIMYIPLTHMSHFIAKYFTYHAIRWDDMPNLNQKALTSKIAEYLTYKPTWSAPHVGADGKATWADIATKNPNTGESK